MREGFIFNKFFLDFSGKRDVKHVRVNSQNSSMDIPKITSKQKLKEVYNNNVKLSDNVNTLSSNQLITEINYKNLKLDYNKESNGKNFKPYILVKNKKNKSISCFKNGDSSDYQSELPYIKIKDFDSAKILPKDNRNELHNKFLRNINLKDVLFFEKKFVIKPFKY